MNAAINADALAASRLSTSREASDQLRLEEGPEVRPLAVSVLCGARDLSRLMRYTHPVVFAPCCRSRIFRSQSVDKYLLTARGDTGMRPCCSQARR